MTHWSRRRILATSVTLGTAGLAVRAGFAQTVVAPPGSTVVVPSLTAQAQAGRNVADAMAADGRFTQFLALLGRAGMIDQLRGSGPFTVFAPTDTAFLGAPSAMIQDLVGSPGGGGSGSASPDPVRLQALVQYHIVAGSIIHPGGDQRARAMNGSDVRVVTSDGALRVSNPAPGQQMSGMGASGLNVMPPAASDGPAIPASNGVVYPIGGVLFP